MKTTLKLAKKAKKMIDASGIITNKDVYTLLVAEQAVKLGQQQKAEEMKSDLVGLLIEGSVGNPYDGLKKITAYVKALTGKEDTV